MGRKICIVTGTRADWGLLSPVARALKECPGVTLQVIATNMHLMDEYGATWREIEADGIHIDRRIPMEAPEDSPRGTVKAMSLCLSGMADALDELRPDMMVILGDRYEMLVAASAALIFKIPIAHIAGGAVSRGAFDESIRHAITKMSHIHLVETEEYRRRVIQLGEQPQRVINTGAIGIYNIKHIPLMSHDEIEASIGTTVPPRTLLATFHPATLDTEPPATQCQNLLAALDRHPDYKVIFTYPNNDTDGQVIIRLINAYAQAHPERVAVYRSLGMKRYLSLLKCVKAVIGNSSSGIVEVPSMGIPTLDIGIRQQGRLAASSVYHCGTGIEEIDRGLCHILSDEVQDAAKTVKNPYEQPDTLQQMVNAITQTPLKDIIVKPFYDLPTTCNTIR